MSEKDVSSGSSWTASPTDLSHRKRILIRAQRPGKSHSVANGEITLNDLEPVYFEHRLSPEQAILGRGTYGVVRLMRLKSSGEYFAVKSLDKAIVASTGMLSQVHLEITAQRLVSHEHTVRCWNVVADDTHVHLILDYCRNGDLFRKLRSAPNRRLNERHAFKLFLQLISGLSHIHALGFCHRDLKLENLLLDEKNDLKIADFGWVSRINGRCRNFNFCGTLDYLAPEMIRGSGHDWRVDIWAVGVVLFELLAGKPPFLSTRHYELLDRILNARVHTDTVCGPSRAYGSIKSDALSAVNAFLQTDPDRRVRFADILGLDWVKRMLKETYSVFLRRWPEYESSPKSPRQTTTARKLRRVPPKNKGSAEKVVTSVELPQLLREVSRLSSSTGSELRTRPSLPETEPTPPPLQSLASVLSSRSVGLSRALGGKRGFSRLLEAHKRASSGSSVQPELRTRLGSSSEINGWGLPPVAPYMPPPPELPASNRMRQHRRVVSPRNAVPTTAISEHDSSATADTPSRSMRSPPLTRQVERRHVPIMSDMDLTSESLNTPSTYTTSNCPATVAAAASRVATPGSMAHPRSSQHSRAPHSRLPSPPTTTPPMRAFDSVPLLRQSPLVGAVAQRPTPMLSSISAYP